jgi:hypothetical protein
MTKPLTYWEDMLKGALREVPRYSWVRHTHRPLPPSLWQRHNGRWVRQRGMIRHWKQIRSMWVRRKKLYKLSRRHLRILDRRIKYCRERIAAIRAKTVWDHVKQGVKEAAKEHRCKKAQETTDAH